MRVHVDLDPVGPVSIVTNIPDYRVSLLEGYNGIGKTLTVRLLQVLTGTLPYEQGSRDWTSMCTALGSGSVTIDSLRNDSAIKWTFDTRTWLDAANPIQDAWFDELLIDGRTASLDEVKQRLRVHRLAGDETLLDSLAMIVDNHRLAVQHLLDDLTNPGGRLTLSEARLDAAATLLGRVQPERLEEDRKAQVTNEARIATLQLEHGHVTAMLRVLQHAVETRNDLALLLDRGPELEARVVELDKSIDAAQNRRQALDEELRQQIQRAAVSDKVRRELVNARGTRDRNREKLSAATDQLSAAVATLGIASSESAVQKAITATEGELEEFERRKEEADVAPALRSLLDDVGRPLGSAIARGLGERELLELRRSEITVEELARAAEDRRRALEGQPPAPEVLALDREIAERRRRLARLMEVPDLLQQQARFSRLYRENEERVQNLLGTGALEAAERVQTLERQRAAVDREILELAAQRAAARQTRVTVAGGLTEQQLRGDLARLLHEAGLSEDELDNHYASASAREEEIRAELSTTSTRLSSVRDDLARQEAELSELLEILGRPECAWLLTDTVVATPDTALPWLHDLQQRVFATQDRVGAVRNQIFGVIRSLTSIANELRGREALGTLFEDQLSTWLSTEVSAWFDQPLIRQYLFPGAKDVTVNLATRQVTWHTATRAESRPLTAFSSGEQAFAYTQSRLARLDAESDPSAEHLVVLDEFGSFIDEDRLAALYQLLRQRAQKRPQDQVIIILPLREDYAELAKSAVGEQRDQFATLAELLTQDSYVVQDLTP